MFNSDCEKHILPGYTIPGKSSYVYLCANYASKLILNMWICTRDTKIDKTRNNSTRTNALEHSLKAPPASVCWSLGL